MDRLYTSENVKAIYIRTGLFEINSAQLIRMIDRLRNTDSVTRKKLLQKPFKEW